MRNLFTAILGVLLVGALESEARTFYVALEGVNGGPGTYTSPWRTINYAVSAASGVMAGDTVVVRHGNYPESVIPEISGTAALPIVLCKLKSEKVTLNPGKFRFESGINYWKIWGLSILYSDASGFALSGAHAVDFLTIEKCTMSHHKEDGVYLNNSFGGVKILDCTIEYNGEWNGVQQNDEGHGIVIYGSGPGKLVVKHCLVANNWHKGIAYGSELQFSGDGTEIDSNLIINNFESGVDFSPDNSYFMYNYVSCNGQRDTETGEFGDKGFMFTPYAYHSTCAFNVIRSSGGNEIAPLGDQDYYYNNTLCKDVPYTTEPGSSMQAIMTFYAGATPNSVFRNNIFVNLISKPQHHFAIIAENYSNYSSQVWSNNLYWCPNASAEPPYNKPFKLYNAPGPGGMYKTLEEVQATWPGTENHSIYVSPGFVSYPDSNFTLQLGSPAIDAGAYVGFQYSGQAPDIGRFEYNQGSTHVKTDENPPLLNYLLESGAVLALSGVGADEEDVRIDLSTNRLVTGAVTGEK